jgi:phosphoribosyl 1,2-cyclic phosphodiesterase
LTRRRSRPLRFAILGSGSRGNALLVEHQKTRLLIDCGFGLRETDKRLARLGVEPDTLTAIVLTHEHGDHANGAAALARRGRTPLWMTPGTVHALGAVVCDAVPALHEFGSHERFAIGDIELQPYTVPHDAREPCQFVFSDGARRLGLLTDVGHVTHHIEAQLRGVDGLILECNHDLDLLAESAYPPSLKARIGGPHGHLHNEAAAALLAGLDSRRLQHVVAAHLSEKTNTPWLARTALGVSLGGETSRVEIASQDSGLLWRELV